MTQLDTWIHERSNWLNDRHFKKYIVHTPKGYKTFDNYYQILVDPEYAYLDVCYANQLIPLFDDVLILNIYTN